MQHAFDSNLNKGTCEYFTGEVISGNGGEEQWERNRTRGRPK